MEKKLIYVLTTTFLIFISIMAVPPCSSEVVWSEDFDDGDMEGWTVTQGNFTVVNGYLESVVNEEYKGVFAGGGSEYFLLSCCFTQSNVAVGTWSFDVYFDCASELPELAVEFMTKKQTRWGLGMPLGAEAHGKTYGIYAGYNIPGSYELYTAPSFPVAEQIKLYSTVQGLKRKEWHHIDITRDEEGQIRVYINGVLGIDTIDTRVTESYYFGIMLEYCFRGKSYIDNIVVSNTIDVQPSEADTQKSGSIPSFPIESVIAGLIVVSIIIWSIQRRNYNNPIPKTL